MKEINYADLVFHPTNMLANEWMIVCAGNQDTGYNGMTVSWGHFGSIWGYDGKHNLPTILVYVRPSRYTLGFIEKEEYFTVNLLPQSRDCDKFKEANLTPGFIDHTTYIKESKYVFVCKKLYR